MDMKTVLVFLRWSFGFELESEFYHVIVGSSGKQYTRTIQFCVFLSTTHTKREESVCQRLYSNLYPYLQE
jgi:hypothetical protein